MVESQEFQHGEGNTQGASPAIPRARRHMQDEWQNLGSSLQPPEHSLRIIVETGFLVHYQPCEAFGRLGEAQIIVLLNS